MPKQNKRFNRNIPQNAQAAAKPSPVTNVTSNPVQPAASAPAPRPSMGTRPNPYNVESMSSLSYIYNEIKSICLVAGILIVILILVYMFLH
jgi:hypothetical protein